MLLKDIAGGCFMRKYIGLALTVFIASCGGSKSGSKPDINMVVGQLQKFVESEEKLYGKEPPRAIEGRDKIRAACSDVELAKVMADFKCMLGKCQNAEDLSKYSVDDCPDLGAGIGTECGNIVNESLNGARVR
jgi:hypothetical protein